MNLVLDSASAERTEELAARLGAALERGAVLLLDGTLGAGKTCFVRGLARGLGIDPRRVKSPTYNVMHRHEGGGRTLDHFDAYFIREEDEFARMGLDDAIAEGHVIAVEWAGRFPGAFPADAVRVRLEATAVDGRRITLDAGGPVASAALTRFTRNLEDDGP